ncbi:hypothetical protein HZA87_02585 [Candidatus Uhrbacteria bacterium]|nr:hypothetical protein [Candidatus Uhrbacteria bacterium]
MDIRSLTPGDDAHVISVYRRAFGGAPWHQELGKQEVSDIWRDHVSRPGFGCLVAVVDARVVAATWYDVPTLTTLAKERGEELARFAGARNPVGLLIWIRETVCETRTFRVVASLVASRWLCSRICERSIPTASH